MDQRKKQRKKGGSEEGKEEGKKEEKNISIGHGNPGPKARAGVAQSQSLVPVTAVHCPIYSPLNCGSGRGDFVLPASHPLAEQSEGGGRGVGAGQVNAGGTERTRPLPTRGT